MINLELPSRIPKEKLILEAKLRALIAASASLSTIDFFSFFGGVGGWVLGFNSRITRRWFAHWGELIIKYN